MLTANHVTFFKTFGYLHLPGYFSEDIHWITQEYETAWAASTAAAHDGSSRTIYPGVFIGASQRLASLLEHPKVRAACSALLGPGYGFHATDGNAYAGDTGWHADAFNQWPDKTTAVHLKMAFYLDPLTRETGALRVIPGSHWEGDRFCAHLQAQLPEWVAGRELRMPGRDIPAVAIESQPGDLVCFDHRIMHASFGGGRRRRMFTTNWIQGDTTPAMRTAIMDIFRFGRDTAGIDWTAITGDWFEHPPADRIPLLHQLKTFGPLVMQERQGECGRLSARE